MCKTISQRALAQNFIRQRERGGGTLNIPEHLQPFLVDQSDELYTSEQHAIWRAIMKKLLSVLQDKAHPLFFEGLKKTGISPLAIPQISEIAKRLEDFGWSAAPVSGFIPPSVFMELQSLSILPIATALRALEHIDYTPAPDIVHEATGHAPLLIHPEYSAYLKDYAQVSRKAIFAEHDIRQYQIIRKLSDLKELDDGTEKSAAVLKAERELHDISAKIPFVSEAGKISRMNWWTAEYGLLGPLSGPKIIGAGLLSSAGEASQCLQPSVRKIRLSADCVHQSYDITEPQPQLFVAEDFSHLRSVLNEVRDQMSYVRGGLSGLKVAMECKTVCTVVLDSGLQVSGVFTDVLRDGAYVRASGPVQLSYRDSQIPGHGSSRHPTGFGFALGSFRTLKPLRAGERNEIHYDNGVRVVGVLVREQEFSYAKEAAPSAAMSSGGFSDKIYTFSDARVTLGDELLFDHSWGEFDWIVGQTITSVFGGPADRRHFQSHLEFPAERVPKKITSEDPVRKKFFDLVHQMRLFDKAPNRTEWIELSQTLSKSYPNDPLIAAELEGLSE